MRAGKIDVRITIQRKTTETSNSGEPVETWSDLSTRWASIEPLTGTERLVGENLVAKEQVRFETRYADAIADLSPLDRIIYPVTVTPSDIEIYNIVQASEVGRKEKFLILAYRYAG